MLGYKKKGGPTRPFTHTPDCKIMKADPSTEIRWQEIETGYWVAECQCGKEYWREPPADQRGRLDPFDPSTAHHLPQCQHAHTTDPAVLRLVLDVKDGLEPGYWWVMCLTCQAGWQVLHYAA